MGTEEKQQGSLWKVFRKALKWLLLLLALLITLLAACVIFKIPLPLGVFRPIIEDAATEALGREVTLDGPVHLVVGPNPELTASDLSIANPEGYTAETLLSIAELEGKIDLFALLNSRILVNKLGIHGVRINLEQQASGANWNIGSTPDTREVPVAAGDATLAEAGTPPIRILGIEDALVTGAIINYSDTVKGSEFQLILERLLTTAPVGGQVKIEGHGSYEQEDWVLELTSIAIDQLLSGSGEIPLNLDAVFLGSTLDATLEMELADAPLTIDGSVGIDIIDLARISALQPAPSEEPIDFAELLAPMGMFNANVDLALGELQGLPIGVQDARVDLRLAGGHLDTPLSVTIDDVPLSGQLSLGADTSGISMTATLDAGMIDIGDLTGRHVPGEDITGQLNGVSTAITANGQFPSDIVRTIDLEMGFESAALSFGNEGTEERVELILDDFSASIAPADSLSANLSGQLLGEPLTLALSGPSVTQLFDEDSWQMDMQAHSEVIDIAAGGNITRPTETTGPSVNIRIEGDRFGELSSWIGIDPDSTLAYRINGHLGVTATTWAAGITGASLGETTFNGNLTREISESLRSIVAELHFDTINVDELAAAFSTAGGDDIEIVAETVEPDGTEPETRAQRVFGAPEDAIDSLIDATDDINLRTPLYPKGIRIPELNFLFSVDTLKLRDEVLTDISIGGRSRGGALEMADVRASLPGMKVEGDLFFDPSSTPRTLDLRLSSDDADLGLLFSSLDIAEGLDLTAEEVDMVFHLEGRRLDQMLEEATLSANIRDARWLLDDPNTEGELAIEIHEGELTMTPDDGIRLVQDTTVRGNRTTLTVRAKHPARALESEQQELKIDFESPEFHLALDGRITIPVTTSELDLTLSAEGKNLSHLNNLFALELPPYGPFSLQSSFHLQPGSYRFDDMVVKVGSSEASGTMEVDTSEGVPRLNAALVAKEIQLTDFIVEEDQESDTVETDGSTLSKVSDEIAAVEKTVDEVDKQKFTVPEGLQLDNVNADITLNVEQIWSGEDRLGNGNGRLVLEDGHLRIDPLDIHAQGGLFETSLDIEPTEDGLSSHLTVAADELDFGVIARRFSPETEMGGALALDVDLASDHGRLVDALPRANGRIDFALKPENFQSGVIDLWATGVIVAMLPVLDSSNDSIVNCIVARFDVTDGVMNDELIVADTSKIRIRGEGRIDLNKRTIDISLKPVSKRPQFYSLSTPVRISGDLDNYNISVPPLGFVATAIRWSVAYIVVPIRMLFGKKMPEDGADICEAPLQRSP